MLEVKTVKYMSGKMDTVEKEIGGRGWKEVRYRRVRGGVCQEREDE